MKKRRSFRLLSLALAAVLILPAFAGCAKKPEESTAPPPEEPTYCYEQVSDYLLIDTPIHTPDIQGGLAVYSAEIKTFTPEEISAFLTANGDGVTEILEDGPSSDGFSRIYSVQCARGGTAFQRAAMEEDFPATFSYHVPDKARWYCSRWLDSGKLDPQRDNYLTHLFTEPTELSFATAAEAEARVRELLAALGLTDLVLDCTLYLSHDRLAQAQALSMTDEWIDRFSCPLPDGNFLLPNQTDGWKESWTEADDCYRFDFYCGADGIPMSLRDEKSTTVSYCGNYITVNYTADGIVNLSIRYPWTIGPVKETSDSWISGYQALSMARERYANLLHGNYTISDVSLVYQYRQDGSGWLLHPIWEVLVIDQSMGVEYPQHNCVRYDAITGEEL